MHPPASALSTLEEDYERDALLAAQERGRRDAAAEKLRELEERLEAKRLAAKEAEKAKLASMSSEAKEKYLLKKQRIEQKRLMKRRTVRG